MNKDIEKLIKVQGILNKRLFHLCIRTNLEDEAEWYLYQIFSNIDHYMSSENHLILNSEKDTIDDLIHYLEKHNGFSVHY